MTTGEFNGSTGHAVFKTRDGVFLFDMQLTPDRNGIDLYHKITHAIRKAETEAAIATCIGLRGYMESVFATYRCDR